MKGNVKILFPQFSNQTRVQLMTAQLIWTVFDNVNNNQLNNEKNITI
jgi:hypothetical protein